MESKTTGDEQEPAQQRPLDFDFDPRTVFPKTKIKNMMLQTETMPRISAKATDVIAACSVIFVQQLATIASLDVNDEGMVDADCVEMCVEGDAKYEFLEDVMDEFAERRKAASATHGTAAGTKAANLHLSSTSTAKSKAVKSRTSAVDVKKKKSVAAAARAIKMNLDVHATVAVADGPSQCDAAGDNVVVPDSASAELFDEDEDDYD